MSSGAVDTKTVEMRFDNQNFEKNCRQSMSTLEKLKSALKLDGASKGLTDIEKAAKKLDMKDLQGNIDSVGKKFSALETIATGVFLKIGMAAADAGMKIVKSLTIDQVTAGWNKYEEKTTAVQTIMNNLTEAEGDFIDEASKMEYVAGYLEKLQWFSDETSYSFTDMTSNVGKFIANGQNLSDSITAMQGIATWAAKSGQNSQAAARAMYNISQAMGTGSMQVRDWMSIENANMATAEFKKLAIAVGEKQGKIKEGTVAVEQFRDSLSGKDSKGWFDKDVMMEVFQTYGAAADRIHELAEESGKTATEIIKDLKNSTEETDKQFVESLGFKAFVASQEAKTFTEAIAATSDAVSTQWLRIFESIFGNYLEQKELWTDLSNSLWDIFAGPLDKVNEILDVWNEGIDGIAESGRKLLLSGIKDVFDTLFHSYTSEDGKEFISILGAIKQAFKDIFFAGETVESVGKKLAELTLRFKNFTDRVKEFLYGDKTSGIQKIKNAFEGLFTVFNIGLKIVKAIIKPFKELFSNLFPKGVSGILDLADGLADLIKRFDDFLEEIGFFEAISDSISWVFDKIGKGIDWLSIKLTGLSFSDLLSKAKVSVSDFFENADFKSAFQAIGGYFSNIIDQIKLVNTDKLPEKLTPLQNFFVGLKNIFNGFKSFFSYISPAFKFIGEKINSFLTSIGEAFENRKLNKAPSRFQPIFEGIKSVFSGIGNFFTAIGPTLKKIGDWLGEALGNLGEAIAKFAENKSAIEIVESILKGGFFIALTNFINSLAGLNKGGKGILKSISGDLDAIKGVLKAYQREINVSTLLELAMAVGVFAASMWVLAQIPADRLQPVGKAIMQIAAAIAGFSVIKDVVKFFTKANNTLEGANGEGVFGKIKSIFTGMVSASIFANDASAKFLKFSAGIFLAALAAKKIADAVKILGEALVKLGKEDDTAVNKGLKIVAKIVTVFGIFALMSGFANKTGSALLAALAALVLIKAIAKLVNLMAEVGADAGKMANIKKFLETFASTFKALGSFILKFVAIIAVAEILMAIAAASSMTAGLANVLKQFGNNFLKIAASLVIVAAAVKIFAGIDFKEGDIARVSGIFGGFIVIVGVLQLVMAAVSNNYVGAVGHLPDILKQFGNNFLKIAASLVIVAAAVKVLLSADFKDGDLLKVSVIFGGFIALVSLFQIWLVKVSNSKAAIAQGAPLVRILKAFGNNFLKIAASLIIVAAAVKLCVGIDFKEGDVIKVAAIFGGFIALVGLISVLAIALSANPTATQGKIISAIASIAGLLIATALSLFIVEEAVRMMQSLSLSPAEAIEIGAIFGGFILLVGLMGVLSGALTNNWSGVAGIAALAVSYLAAAYSLQLLAGAFNQMKDMTDLGQLAVIGIIFGAFIGIIGVMGTLAGEFVNNWSGVAAMAVIAASYVAAAYSMQLLAGAFNQMKDMTDLGQLAVIGVIFGGFIAVVGVMGILAGDMVDNAIGAGAMAVLAGSYIAAAYSMQLLAEAFTEMQGMTDLGQLAAIGLIFGGFIAVVGVFGVLAGAFVDNAKGIAAMAVLAGSYLAAALAIQIVASAMTEMCEITSVDQLKQAEEIMIVFLGLVGILGLIGGVLGTIGGAGALMGMAGIAGIIISIGAACLFAGAGIGLAAAGLGLLSEGLADLVEALAKYGPEAAANVEGLVVAILTTIINAAPLLAEVALVLIEAFAYGLVGGAKILAVAAVTLIASLLDVLNSAIPALGTKIVALIGTALATIADAIRAASTIILPALMDIFSAIIEALLEVIAEILGTIPGVGPKIAAKIRSWKGNVNEALTSVFEDGGQIGAEGAEAVVDGFSGGGSGKSFAEAGEEKGKELTDAFNEEMSNASATTTKDATKDFLEEMMSTIDTNGVDVNASFADVMAQMGMDVNSLTAGEDMGTKMSDILNSVEGGGIDINDSFGSVMAQLGIDVSDLSIVQDMQTKMSDMTSAVDNEAGPAADAANKVTSSIQSEMTSMNSYSWGSDLGAKFASGISSKTATVRSAALALANAVSAVLHFSEPDEGPLSNFHTFAPDMVKLWNKGIYDNLGSVESSSESMANTIYDGFSTALDYVSDLIDDGMSDELTIRPIMDLSEIQNGISSLNGMIGSADGYSLSGTARLASSAAYSMSGRATTATDTTAAVPVAPVNNYNTFNITNNDPSAVAQKVSKLLDQDTRRAQAVWARR